MVWFTYYKDRKRVLQKNLDISELFALTMLNTHTVGRKSISRIVSGQLTRSLDPRVGEEGHGTNNA